MTNSYDLVVCGGGMVGMCGALAASRQSRHVALIEKNLTNGKLSPRDDLRSITLSAHSKKILSSLSIWDELVPHCQPIANIQITHQGAYGAVRSSAKKHGLDAFGYVVPMNELNRILASRLNQSGVSLIAGQLQDASWQNELLSLSLLDNDMDNIATRLLIGADGLQSRVRDLFDLTGSLKDYQQEALVCNLRVGISAANTAFERFTDIGPMAILPRGGMQAALIWCGSPEEISALRTCSDEDFIQQLQACFGYHLGDLSLSSNRVSFPLRFHQTKALHARRALLLGYAANPTHPVAAQGFNLALRDIGFLSQLLSERDLKDWGSADMLSEYAKLRYWDHLKIRKLTDGLATIFSHPPGKLESLALSFGMGLFDQLNAFRRLTFSNLLGFSGTQSDLACGITDS